MVPGGGTRGQWVQVVRQSRRWRRLAQQQKQQGQSVQTRCGIQSCQRTDSLQGGISLCQRGLTRSCQQGRTRAASQDHRRDSTETQLPDTEQPRQHFHALLHPPAVLHMA